MLTLSASCEGAHHSTEHIIILAEILALELMQRQPMQLGDESCLTTLALELRRCPTAADDVPSQVGVSTGAVSGVPTQRRTSHYATSRRQWMDEPFTVVGQHSSTRQQCNCLALNCRRGFFAHPGAIGGIHSQRQLDWRRAASDNGVAHHRGRLCIHTGVETMETTTKAPCTVRAE